MFLADNDLLLCLSGSDGRNLVFTVFGGFLMAVFKVYNMCEI